MENKNRQQPLQDVLFQIRKSFYQILLFSCAINLFILTVPLYLLQVYTRVLSSKSYETLLYLTLIALIAIAVMGCIEVIRSRMLQTIGIWTGYRLSPPALKAAVDEILHENRYGVQCLQDLEIIRRFLSGQGVIALLDSPWTILFIFVIFLIHVLLGMIAVLGAAVLIVLAILNQWSTHKSMSHANKASVKEQKYIDTATRNAEAIMAMGMLDSIVTAWENRQKMIKGLQGAAGKKSSLIVGMSKFFRAGLQILMLCAGAVLVLNHQINAGAMIVASILLGRALAPVETAIAQWGMINTTRDAYKRLKNHLTQISRPVISLSPPTVLGAIDLDDVVWNLPDRSTPLLDHISYHFQPGQVYLLTGPSGVGKSTLAKLILGIYKPSSGCIRMDGSDVYQWERQDFGRHVGYLPQDIELFPGSIKENIARMGRVDEQQVILAANTTSIHKMILGFPKGYDTEIESGGMRLSGGQKQRIALARALYQEPKVLVLDEPNSNLDIEGEKALYRVINELKKRETTVILISHKMNVKKLIDKTVTISNGMLQEINEK